jgi:hypothetical protein
MGYEIEMQARLLRLLKLFEDCSPDKETHEWVWELVANEKNGIKAHDLFDLLRRRSLKYKGSADCRGVQYAFEELCLKTVFNETDTKVPFDTNSSFWLAGSAFHFARRAGVPIDFVLAIIAPEKD